MSVVLTMVGVITHVPTSQGPTAAPVMMGISSLASISVVVRELLLCCEWNSCFLAFKLKLYANKMWLFLGNANTNLYSCQYALYLLNMSPQNK